MSERALLSKSATHVSTAFVQRARQKCVGNRGCRFAHPCLQASFPIGIASTDYLCRDPNALREKLLARSTHLPAMLFIRAPQSSSV
jgi:hypothetical protein